MKRKQKLQAALGLLAVGAGALVYEEKSSIMGAVPTGGA